MKFYTSVRKGLKLKVRMFWGINTRFVEVTGGKLVGGTFWPTTILTRIKINNSNNLFKDFSAISLAQQISDHLLPSQRQTNFKMYSLTENFF